MTIDLFLITKAIQSILICVCFFQGLFKLSSSHTGKNHCNMSAVRQRRRSELEWDRLLLIFLLLSIMSVSVPVLWLVLNECTWFCPFVWWVVRLPFFDVLWAWLLGCDCDCFLLCVLCDMLCVCVCVCVCVCEWVIAVGCLCQWILLMTVLCRNIITMSYVIFRSCGIKLIIVIVSCTQ